MRQDTKAAATKKQQKQQANLLTSQQRILPQQRNHHRRQQSTSQRSEVADSEGESYAPPPPGKSSTQKKYTSAYGMGISLSSLSENKVNEPESTGEVKEVSDRVNSARRNCWQPGKNLQSSSLKKLLKNTMTLYLPRLIGEELFEVEVNTELNSQYLNDYSYSILSFLREKLDNGEITMSIRIAEGMPSARHSPRVKSLKR